MPWCSLLYRYMNTNLLTCNHQSSFATHFCTKVGLFFTNIGCLPLKVNFCTKFLGTIFSGPLISIKSLFLHPHLRGLIPWSLPFKCLQFRILYGCIQKMHPIKVKGFYHDSIEHYILHLSDKHLQEMQSEIFACLPRAVLAIRRTVGV